jgi:hypothetical protein
MNIQERIDKLKVTLHDLTKSHEEMVAENQRQNQEFQQTAARNQQQFQQLRGAIAELESMMKEDTSNANQSSH